MSEPANTLKIHDDMIAGEICRDDRCQLLGVHVAGPSCIKFRGRESLYRTRSRRHATQPWRAYNYEALHESVYAAVSLSEPRNFQMIVSHVENDYGTVCERSIHRHLAAWRVSGEIVRMDFPRTRVHAYLRQGSRLLRDPDLVFEQIIDLHAEQMSWAEGTGVRSFVDDAARDEFKPQSREGSGYFDAAYASERARA